MFGSTQNQTGSIDYQNSNRETSLEFTISPTGPFER
jgi:hypothetical protein